MKFALDTGVLVASVKRIGEKFHPFALQFVSNVRKFGHETVLSVLAFEELRGALSSATSMPSDKIFQVEASLEEVLMPSISSYDEYVAKAEQLMLSFRDLKRLKKIPTADFHHVATAIGEGADIFVTVDEKHLLAAETRERFASMIRILNPEEATRFVQERLPR